MVEVAEQIPIAGADFWEQYDAFCTEAEFTKLADYEQTERCLLLQEILRSGELNFVKLSRPEKGWHHPKAWLVLRREEIINRDGHSFLSLHPCDVMTREFGWDRDVFVTHAPIIERVSGQFLNQSWHGAKKGLFLPLYAKEAIFMAIKIRYEKNLENAMKKAVDESSDWGWY